MRPAASRATQLQIRDSPPDQAEPKAEISRAVGDLEDPDAEADDDALSRRAGGGRVGCQARRSRGHVCQPCSAV